MLLKEKYWCLPGYWLSISLSNDFLSLHFYHWEAASRDIFPKAGPVHHILEPPNLHARDLIP